MTEPVLIGLAPALITGLIAALANVLKAFGIADITDAQIDALNALILPLMLLLAAVGTWFGRRFSTPTAAPRVAQGTSITVVTPGDAPNETIVA